MPIILMEFVNLILELRDEIIKRDKLIEELKAQLEKINNNNKK